MLTKANESSKHSAPLKMKHGIYFIFNTLKSGDLTKEKKLVWICVYYLERRPGRVCFIFKEAGDVGIGGAFFPCLFNLGKTSAVWSFYLNS